MEEEFSYYHEKKFSLLTLALHSMAYYSVWESILSGAYTFQFLLVAQLSFSSLANIPLPEGVSYEGREGQIPPTWNSESFPVYIVTNP